MKYLKNLALCQKLISTKVLRLNAIWQPMVKCSVHSDTTKGKDNLRTDTFLTWDKKTPNTEMEKFRNYIGHRHNLTFNSYWDFHSWSVMNKEKFWGDAWHFYETVSSKPYDEVFHQHGPGFLDNQWFKGAKLNFAENMMKYRDNKTAITYFDTERSYESFTFAEMYDQVRLYAAAFKKHGLQKGDTVGCYMSNRPEAIFAMLATVSIGAIWSGASPLFGVKAGSIIMKIADPKFVIAVDRNFYGNEETNILTRLPTIIADLTDLKKVIIVPTKKSTMSEDISNIRNSCLLQDFLESGKLPDGKIPELVFEQVSPEHPVFLNFTSGTTGTPKGVVHSTKVFLPNNVNHACHFNLKRGDTYMCPYGMGWTLWHFAVTVLGIGVRVLLYSGYNFQKDEDLNIWNVIAEHNATFIALVPSAVDKLEKENILPSPKYDMKNLRLLSLGGSPAKIKNAEFILQRISKDVLVASIYGATEFMTYITGLDWNLPVHVPEVQVPSLGVDLQCIDSNGKPVIGQRGEVAITTPNPAFMIGVWKDENKAFLKETYFSKFSGIWCQHDQAWINPKTKGMQLLGRSDDTIIQNGDRFLPTDIYFAIEGMAELDDFICVPQKKSNGEDRAVLFVKLKKGFTFSQQLKEQIQDQIEAELIDDCVPEVVLPVTDIPYNVNGKKMESLVKKIVATNQVPNISNIRNPECVKQFCDIAEILSFK